MESEGKSPPNPKQHTRKRSLPEAGGPRTRRKTGNAAAVAIATESEIAAIAIAVSMPSPQLDDGIGIASSSASDVPSTAAVSTSATPRAMVHFCGHCQKRFRSPAKLAQHERVHTTRDAAISCSFCPKQFKYQSEATVHERAHKGEQPYA